MNIALKFAVVLISVALLGQSCKKTEVEPVNNTPKVKTYIEQVTNFSNTSSDTLHVSYDNSDRIVSLISPSSGYQFLYSYNATSSYIMQLKKGTHLQIHLVGFLNANLLLDSSFQYNDTKDSTTMKLIYNASKQVIEQKTYTYSLSKGVVLNRRSIYTYNAEGNVLTHVELAANGTTSYTETYTYTSFAGTNFGYGTPYAPQLYKKLPATISIQHTGSNTTGVSNYSYVFDNSNRLIKSTQTNSAGNSLVKQFEYY